MNHYDYEKLLEDNDYEESDLPEEIRQAIDKLHDLAFDLSEETDDEEISQLTLQLRQLDKEIIKLIRELLDDEAEDDLPLATAKENILAEFYGLNQKKVPLKNLKVRGYPIPSGSKWTEKVGPFTLQKRLYEDYAHLTKN